MKKIDEYFVPWLKGQKMYVSSHIDLAWKRPELHRFVGVDGPDEVRHAVEQRGRGKWLDGLGNNLDGHASPRRPAEHQFPRRLARGVAVFQCRQDAGATAGWRDAGVTNRFAVKRTRSGSRLSHWSGLCPPSVCDLCASRVIPRLVPPDEKSC